MLLVRKIGGGGGEAGGAGGEEGEGLRGGVEEEDEEDEQRGEEEEEGEREEEGAPLAVGGGDGHGSPIAGRCPSRGVAWTPGWGAEGVGGEVEIGRASCRERVYCTV